MSYDVDPASADAMSSDEPAVEPDVASGESGEISQTGVGESSSSA
jgi:hypothetical protein